MNCVRNVFASAALTLAQLSWRRNLASVLPACCVAALLVSPIRAVAGPVQAYGSMDISTGAYDTSGFHPNRYVSHGVYDDATIFSFAQGAAAESRGRYSAAFGGLHTYNEATPIRGRLSSAGGSARASFSDNLHFHIPGGVRTLDFIDVLQLRATVSSVGPGPGAGESQASVDVTFYLLGGEVAFLSAQSINGVGDAHMTQIVDVPIHIALPDVGGLPQSWSTELAGVMNAGSVAYCDGEVVAVCGYALADGFNTATDSIRILTPGVTLTTDSGATYSPGTAVPEPTAWAMMVAGVFGVGGFARAGRRKPKAAAT